MKIQRAKYLTMPMLARMVELRNEAELSFAAIAAVMNLDYGLNLDASCVRYMLVYSVYAPASVRRHVRVKTTGYERVAA